jgi:hypothetical protein
MRIRIAVAATALGALVVLGGATAANADTDDQDAFGTSQGNFGTSSKGNQDWQGPAFDDQAAAGLGTEGNLDLGQKQTFGGADASFLP